MGCSSSKHQSNLTDKNAPLSRSVSFPSYHDNEGVSSSKFSWESRHLGNDTFEGGFTMNQELNAGHERPSEIKPMNDKDIAMLDCKEQYGIRRSAVSNNGGHDEDRKHAVFETGSYSPLRKVPDEAGLSLWENKLRKVKVKPMDSASSCVDNGASSFRCAESMDANSGLRLLLSPVTTPSRSITASSRFGNFTKTLSSSARFIHNLNDDMDFSRAINSLSVHDRTLLPSEIEGMGDSEEPGSPLFDPSILATFERAIEASSEDTWPSSEVSTSSSSRIVCSTSDICSDADSSNWSEESSIPEACESMCSENGDSQRQINISMNGFSHSKTAPFIGIGQTQKNYLDDFECKSPPGSEDKVVLYFTSLRGVRKTYENCCLVRLILKGFGVHVDERDIWMHSKFKEELTNVMGVALSVPRLFIKGRYIGGAEDVKQLHEEGVLQNLLEGLPAECNSMCDICGGVRFVPCTTCSGSRKMIFIDEISRCPDCNENGLILCPLCGL